jgi:hypothetical protein
VELVTPVTCRLWAPSATAPTPARALYQRAVRTQWDAASAIDWSIEVPFGEPLPDDAGYRSFRQGPLGRLGRPFWDRFRWEFHAWLVSQFRFGEEAALIGAARLVELAGDVDTKCAAASQVMDEARHLTVFDDYIRRKLPTGYGASPPFAELVRVGLEDGRDDVTVLGTQVLVEGVALAAFRLADLSLHDPLILDIVSRVAADEARHVALGTVVLRDVYTGLSSAERRERADVVADAARLTARQFLLGEVWERLGVARGEGEAFAATDPTMAAYRRAVFAKVVQIVRAVGLLDDRLVHELESLQVLVRRRR